MRGTTQRMPRWPLLVGARTRVLAAFLILLASSTVVSTLALRQLLLARVNERVDASLLQEVQEFQILASRGRDPQTAEPFGTDIEAIFDTFLGRNVPDSGETVLTFVGTELYRTTATTGPPFDAQRLRRAATIRRPRRGTVDSDRGDLRYAAVPISAGGERLGAFIVTAEIERERQEVVDSVQVAAGVSIGVLAIASLLAWIIAGRVLAPLRQLRDTARGITETDLTRRIEVKGRDEVAELGRTFNDMIDRLEGAFASQRAFVSDAGHELRTPITIIRGHLELLGDDPRERADTIDVVTDELDRMSRFVDDLLTLAKSERTDFLHPGPVDLDELTEELLTKATGLAPRDWRLEGNAAGRITADRQRVTQAVMNLAHNAVQHTRDGDAVALGSALLDGEARLWVRDSGPGVPADQQERIFERFARSGNSIRRSEGAGLGLAIVRAIAEAHGGRVELDSGEGTGSVFTVVLPVDQREETSEQEELTSA
ncbi:MAG: HAMP domain-containing histidine kinase [Solirubrobacteraceae bacterium MAG38_C4-C5]|nr:HAMP domain-containing histidine kinase [Candidatus Siliceabacter maunaloa]